MILADLGDSWLAVNQNDHAALAAEFLSLWRADGLPEHPLREDLLFATRHHDDGWLEADSAPRCRADGVPHDFVSMPDEARLEIWLLGVARHIERRNVASLLITQHALHLHRRPPKSAAWSEAIERWRSLRDELCEELGVETGILVSTHRWLEAADTLSLAACGRWSEPLDLEGGYRVEPMPEPLPPEASSEVTSSSLRLDPFPLAGATTFELRARRIEKRHFTSNTDLAMELAMARWSKYRIRLSPRDFLAGSSWDPKDE